MRHVLKIDRSLARNIDFEVVSWDSGEHSQECVVFFYNM